MHLSITPPPLPMPAPRVPPMAAAAPVSTAAAPPVLSLWRGVSNMDVTSEVLERGGTIIAPTSLSTNRAMAVEMAVACHSSRNAFPPCLLKIRSGGAAGEAMSAVDVRFLSLYPREAQYLLPPGVHLHCARGEAELLTNEADGGAVRPDGTVVPLVQVELVPTPLKGAWVPGEHEMQRALAAHAESGGKMLTPRGGLATPRGAGMLATPRCGLASPRRAAMHGPMTMTPRGAAPTEPAGGLW